MKHEFELTEGQTIPDDPGLFDRLIDRSGPASILVVIRARMSAALRQKTCPEDIWQETLAQAWQSRTATRWRGVTAFRRWLLSIAENRIRDVADHEGAAKRGAGVPHVSIHAGERGDAETHRGVALLASTTPSRVASHAEQAAIMQEVLGRLAESHREIVRLRLFEELEMAEVARRTGLGLAACKSRFRKGAAEYHRYLQAALGNRSRSRSGIVHRDGG